MSAVVSVPSPAPPKKYARSPHANEYKSGRPRGPRGMRRVIARVPNAVMELLSALFDIQRDDDGPQHPATAADHELHAGEILETYIVDSAPLIFGMTYFDYVRRRDKGEVINLRALFELRHAQLLGGVQ